MSDSTELQAAHGGELDNRPRLTNKAKLIRIGELATDHTLAMLENADPGSLNAHALKVVLQLIRDAGVSPIEADHERAQAEREKKAEQELEVLAFDFPDEPL